MLCPSPHAIRVGCFWSSSESDVVSSRSALSPASRLKTSRLKRMAGIASCLSCHSRSPCLMQPKLGRDIQAATTVADCRSLQSPPPQNGAWLRAVNAMCLPATRFVHTTKSQQARSSSMRYSAEHTSLALRCTSPPSLRHVMAHARTATQSTTPWKIARFSRLHVVPGSHVDVRHERRSAEDCLRGHQRESRRLGHQQAAVLPN